MKTPNEASSEGGESPRGDYARFKMQRFFAILGTGVLLWVFACAGALSEHGRTSGPLAVFFPYAACVMGLGRMYPAYSPVGILSFGLLFFFQVPVYAYLLSRRGGPKTVSRTLYVLLIAHVVAAGAAAVFLEEKTEYSHPPGMKPVEIYGRHEARDWDKELDQFWKTHPEYYANYYAHLNAIEPTFWVPEAVTNIARGKTITCSTDPRMVAGSLSDIVSGEQYAPEDKCVLLPPGRQWIQIDLGGRSTIYAIGIWHRFDHPQVFHDVIVQISDDPAFAGDVITLYNNDDDGSANLGPSINTEYVERDIALEIKCKDGLTARYVRLYSCGNTLDSNNAYARVEIHGVPAK